MENGKKDVIMKKFSFYIALSIMVVVTGCQMEEMTAPESNGSVMEVYASIEDIADTDTRTYMDGAEVLWSSGDQIAVFLKNTLRKRFTVTPESVGGKDATFLYDSEYIMMGNNAAISNNVAYYPFCDVTCAADGRTYILGNITLPSVQSYAASSVAPGTYPMVAVTSDIEDVNYYFKNVCGAMMFQLKGYGFIKSVTVRGNSDEVLAGAAIVTVAHDDLPSIAVAADGSKAVTLDCGNGVELDAVMPTSFFIALPPVPFTNGFTVIVTDTWGGTKEYSTSKKNSILRSTILRMPAKEYIGVRPLQDGDYIDEYGISHGPGIEIDDVVWAPVNCGYKMQTSESKGYPYGRYYQWGRKYGQGNSLNFDESVPEVRNVSVSLKEGQSEDNANVFFRPDQTDWLAFSDDRLWNSGSEAGPVKTEYDPCPEGWRVPTYAELKSLFMNRSAWTTNSIGQTGYWFSGSESYTDQVPQLFFPAANYSCDNFETSSRGTSGHYWNSKKNVFFDDSRVGDNLEYRRRGHSVRCVKDDSELIPVESITLSESTVTLSTGSSISLAAAIVPANANHQFAYWWSENDEVATVDSEGNVTAISEGTVTITAMAGMQTATCEVVVIEGKKYVDEYGVDHGAGVEIDGVVWAPVNCGYKAPTADSKGYPYGKLYQWGRKYGQGYDDNDEIYPSGGYLVNGPVDLKIGQDEANAAKFYYSSATPYNWVSGFYGKLWNNGTRDNPIKSEYDPCPEGWRVPTQTEIAKLKASEYSYVTDDQGLSGYWFGGSDAYVFFPFAGKIYYDDGDAIARGSQGCYWSSESYGKEIANANFLMISETSVVISGNYRSNGRSVRCVKDDSELIPVESITLSESTVTLSTGSSISLAAAIVPANANHQFAYWWSENDEVATVDSEGNVTAISEGTVTITAMAGMQTATCEVVVIEGKKYVDEYGVDHGAGVEIDGVVWAPVNCGYHETDFPYGKYYQWGRKFGQKYSPSYMNGPAGESVLLNEKYADIFFWASYGTPFDWYGYSDPTLWNTGTEEAPVKTKYDPCPEGWRVPTYTELTALSANRDSEMSVHDGQKGYWFNDMAQNSGSTGVFLPAAGFIYYDAGSYDQGKEGCYWSSTASSKYYSQRYSFTRTNSMDTCRGNGFSVRCVAE